MAFPTIPTTGAGRLLTSAQTTAVTTHTFPSLSSLTKNAGDLLIAIIVTYDGAAFNFGTWGGGFTEFGEGGSSSAMGIGAAYKFSTGSETGTFTVTASASQSEMFLMSTPAAHPSQVPELGGVNTGGAANPDPNVLDPAGWGTEDTLWIAVGGSGETSTTGSFTVIAAAPASYTNMLATTISADVVGGLCAAVAFRQLNAASENPGAFTGDVSNTRSIGAMVAVRAPVAQSKTITNAAETDAAQALDKDKTKAVGVAGETDAARALRVPKLATAADTGAAQSLNVDKVKTLGTPAETDAAQPLSYLKRKTLGVAVETGTTQSLDRDKIKVLGLASEAETARPLSVTKTIRKTLGLSAEADAAQSLLVTHTGAHVLIPALESGTAQALSYTKTIHKTLGPAIETGTSQVPHVSKIKVVGPATVTESSRVLSVAKARVLAAAVETGLALPAVHLKRASIVPATEADVARLLVVPILVTIQPAAEADGAVFITLLTAIRQVEGSAGSAHDRASLRPKIDARHVTAADKLGAASVADPE